MGAANAVAALLLRGGFGYGLRVLLGLAMTHPLRFFSGLGRGSAGLALALLGLIGCPAEPVDTDVDPPLPVLQDCSALCDHNETAAGEARCYSCRCKNAMDGWLPSPEELQCALGEEIVISTVDADGVLSPIEGEVEACANPSLLYGTCAPGGRLGQLQHGDITVKWICRRNTFVENAADPQVPYEDVGAILYNARNGQSCWYDDVDATGLAGSNWPDLDLTAPDADPSAYLGFFYQTNGRACAACHDNDPFHLTPYLRSIRWETGPHVFGAYGIVDLDGGSARVPARTLVSEEAAPCLACHRISSRQTCETWAPDALGVAKGLGHQDLIVEAIGDRASPLWDVVTWMPVGAPLDAPAEWEQTYGAAAEAISRCCENPGVDGPGCAWEAIPPATP